jgi:hypothetical protein
VADVLAADEAGAVVEEAEAPPDPCEEPPDPLEALLSITVVPQAPARPAASAKASAVALRKGRTTEAYPKPSLEG